MATGYLEELYSLSGRVAVVTGATGVLGGAMAHGLARAGARVAILGRRAELAAEVATAIQQAGGEAVATPADVLNRNELEAAREKVVGTWGRVDILVNAAGGNIPAATLSPTGSFFDLPQVALRQVIDLNLGGTLLPCQVFGAAMIDPETSKGHGSIINISSMAGQRPLTRVVGYAAAKAAIDNFTRWLATYLASTYGEGMRVNAIAPGFYIGEQNRRLLLNEDGTPTQRGQAVLAHTPAGRFGIPQDLISTLLWLCAPSSSFVNGVVVPVDGGFGASSGV